MDQVIRAQFIGLLWDISNQVLMQWGVLLDYIGLFTFPTAFLNTYSVLFAPCTTVQNTGTVGELTGCVFDKTLTNVKAYVNLRNSIFKDQEIIAIGY